MAASQHKVPKAWSIQKEPREADEAVQEIAEDEQDAGEGHSRCHGCDDADDDEKNVDAVGVAELK